MSLEESTFIPQSSRFAYMLGTAVLAWGKVERQLYWHYVDLIESVDWRVSTVAYRAARSIEIQLDMVDSLVRYRLRNTPAFKRWTEDIYPALVEQKKQRNMLVHWPWVATKNDDGTHNLTLIPHRARDGITEPPYDEITLDSLRKTTDAFLALEEQFIHYRGEVMGQLLASPEKSPSVP